MPNPEEAQEDARETKECPICGETILAAARKCRFCGELLGGTPAPSRRASTSRPPRLVGQARMRKFSRDLVQTGERHSNAGAIIVLISAVLGALSIFMPWGSVSWRMGMGRAVMSQSWNGFGTSEGTMAFIGFCAAAALAIAIYNTRTPSTMTTLAWISVGAGALSALCSLIVLGKGQGWTAGIGLILSILCGVGVAVGGFLLTRHASARSS